MKKSLEIISLNTWGGRAGEKLIQFFKDNQDTDIFCLQEIFNGGADDPEEIAENIPDKNYELFSKIQNALPDHVAYFRPAIKDYYGLAMFIKKGIYVIEEGEEFVYQYRGFVFGKDLGFHPRIIQFAAIQLNDKELSIINFHGLWNGQGKTDTADRIQQSKNIVSFTEKLSHDLVLCGDFNLLPDTESIGIIESLGLRNLIKENNSQSTRSSLYTKPDKHADYVFVSKGVVVESFEVMSQEVSDHLPLRIRLGY